MEWRSLPEDLVEDILSRVPAKSLAQLRSTSKQWNTVLKSGSFAKTHSVNAPKKESLIITLIHSRVCLVRINLGDNKAAPSVKAVTPFYLKNPGSYSSSQVDILNVFHCDGLLLCTTKNKRLVLWNPCSGEAKWIEPRDNCKESDYYALGYDNKSSCKQYKILRVDRQDIPIKNEYEIYDLASSSWRVLGVATDWFLAEYRRGISVKGVTYLVATPAPRGPDADFILSFDFSTEKFQSLSLPHPFRYSISALSVVKEEQLCLLGSRLVESSGMYDEETYPCLQIWVRTSTGSWNKSVAVIENYKKEQNYLCNFYKGRMSFLADEQNKVVLYLNPDNILDIVRKNKGIKEHHLGGDSKCISPSSVLLNYVPSLVHIQQGTPLERRRKRKARKASDL